jgi:hypothetical protein
MLSQRTWQRIILLVVLGYEGLGALAGGALLVASPDGRYMEMPVGLMHGTFSDFLIPGLILFGLGLLTVAAFVAVLRKHRTAWLQAGLALGGLAIWFLVEIIIIRELHWLHAMWGLPVILGIAAAIPLAPFPAATMRDTWLGCGVASSLLFMAMNVVAPLRWSAYDASSQVVSELSAVGAPTRPVWVVLGLFYTVLITAFGRGVWMAAAGNRRLQLAGIFIALYGALGLIWPFAPMHARDVLAAGGGTFKDTLHIGLGAVTQVLYLLALAFAAAALGTAFRLYSIATFFILFTFAIPTFRAVPLVGENQPTPLLGVWQRISIGVFLLWVIVLAVVLLVRGHERDRRAPLGALAQPA